MSLKEPKFPEEIEKIAEIEKSRTISDSELLKGGAEYKINEKGEKIMLEATPEQIKSIKDAKELEDKESELKALYTRLEIDEELMKKLKYNFENSYCYMGFDTEEKVIELWKELKEKNQKIRELKNKISELRTDIYETKQAKR